MRKMDWAKSRAKRIHPETPGKNDSAKAPTHRAKTGKNDRAKAPSGRAKNQAKPCRNGQTKNYQPPQDLEEKKQSTSLKIGKGDPKLGKTTKNCPVFFPGGLVVLLGHACQVLCPVTLSFQPFLPAEVRSFARWVGAFARSFCPVFCPRVGSFARSFLPGGLVPVILARSFAQWVAFLALSFLQRFAQSFLPGDFYSVGWRFSLVFFCSVFCLVISAGSFLHGGWVLWPARFGSFGRCLAR